MPCFLCFVPEHIKGLFMRKFTGMLIIAVSIASSAAFAEDEIAEENCSEAFASEHYETALQLCEHDADKGDALAAEHLGYIYLKGKVGSRQWKLARRYLEQSVDAGNNQAYRYLAQLYWNGLGVKRDKAKARDMFNECVTYEKGADLSCTDQFARILGFHTNTIDERKESLQIYEKLLSMDAYEYSVSLAKQALEIDKPEEAFRYAEFFQLWSKRYGDLAKLRSEIEQAQNISVVARNQISEEKAHEGLEWARNKIYAINHAKNGLTDVVDPDKAAK